MSSQLYQLADMLAKLRGIAISVMGHIGYLLRWGLGIHESRSIPIAFFGAPLLKLLRFRLVDLLLPGPMPFNLKMNCKHEQGSDQDEESQAGDSLQ